MKFTIVGAGNAAHFLAARIARSGQQASIWARNNVAANELAKTFGLTQLHHLQEIEDAENHVCFWAVSDGAIAALSSTVQFQKTISVHCSGASPLSALPDQHRFRGVIWPVCSLSAQLADDKLIPAAIEGSEQNVTELLQKVAKALQLNPFETTAENRRKLHLAAVFANNYTNHLIATAQAFCTAAGFPQNVLDELIAQTFVGALSGHAKDLQTGPARRGDERSLKSHENLLANEPELLAVYRALAQSIRKMYSDSAD